MELPESEKDGGMSYEEAMTYAERRKLTDEPSGTQAGPGMAFLNQMMAEVGDLQAAVRNRQSKDTDANRIRATLEGFQAASNPPDEKPQRGDYPTLAQWLLERDEEQNS